jgi:hypothetical protein
MEGEEMIGKPRKPRIPLLLGMAALLLWGCCPQVMIVAIPPSDYRSDTAGLPLTAESKSRLRAFLLAGGDQENIDVNVVDLNAPRYDSLLSLLSDTAKLKVEFLEDSRQFKLWFTEDPVYGVVDARDKLIAPLDPDRPICFLTDERYWWIFYREDGALKYLLIVRNMVRTPEEGA